MWPGAHPTRPPAGAGRPYAEANGIDAVGIDAVLVDGIPVVLEGGFTEARPGSILRAGSDTATPPLASGGTEGVRPQGRRSRP